MLRTQRLRSRGRSYTEAVKELDWRGLAAAFKSLAALQERCWIPSCQDRGLGTILVLVEEGAYSSAWLGENSGQDPGSKSWQ